MLDAPIILASASPHGEWMEDRHLCDPEVPVYAVFDGESAGGVASQMAADVLRAQRGRLLGANSSTAASVLEEGLQAANRLIFERARAYPTIGGTTCTACTITEGEIVVAHVGDSRLYVARDNLWRRVTLDHSLREDIEARAGMSDPDGIAENLTNVVTRVLGLTHYVRVDVYTIPRRGNVALLLCTDGAWRPMDPLGVLGSIPFDEDLAAIGDNILRRCRLDGAHDDATILIARCGDTA
jgi:protein phosphatase